MRTWQANKQRGASLIIVVVSLTALCGMVALAVDMGMIYFARQRAQNCADAAALAGGHLLNGTVDSLTGHNLAADAAAALAATANSNSGALAFNFGDQSTQTLTAYPTSGTFDSGKTWSTDPKSGFAVVVTGYVNAPISFGGVVGFNPTAWWGGPAHALSVKASATVALLMPDTLAAGQAIMPFAGIVRNSLVSPVADYATNNYQWTLDQTANQVYALSRPAGDPNGQILTAHDYQAKEAVLAQANWSQNSISDPPTGTYGAVNFYSASGANDIRNEARLPSPLPISLSDNVSAAGAMVGPILDGTRDRIGGFIYDKLNYPATIYDPPTVTQNPPVSRTAYNQWYQAGEGSGWPDSMYRDPRIVIMPLISTGSATEPARYVGFVGFFLEGIVPHKGNDAIVDNWSVNGVNYTAKSDDVVGRFIFIRVLGSAGSVGGSGTAMVPTLIK